LDALFALTEINLNDLALSFGWENHPELDKVAFADWLGKRRDEVACGELVYIAHQMDFLVKINKAVV